MEDYIEEKHICKDSTTRSPIYPQEDIKVKGFVTYGPAIGRIIKVGGYWLADNDEYSTVINYCPFCGDALPW